MALPGTKLGTTLGTMLGTDLGRGIAKQFGAMFASTDGWYDTSNVTGGTTLVDRVNASRTFAVTAGTITPTSSDANYGGKPSFPFTGTQQMDSNQASAYWKALHDGTGATLVMVYTPTNPDSNDRYLLTTSDANTTLVGFTFLGRGPAANFYGWYINNASGGFAANPDPAMGLTAGTPLYADFQVASGANQAVLRAKGTTSYTGTLSAPSSANPHRTLRIGSNNLGNFGHFTFRALYYWQRVLTASERALAQEFIRYDTGIAP